MKKLFVLGLAIVLFVSCQERKQRYVQSSAEIDAVKSLLKDYHAGDWKAWAGHYADTAKIYFNTIKGATVAETIASLKQILANTSAYKFDDKNQWYEMVLDDDNETWVNFWGNWRGKLSANGKELVIPVHLTLQFVNGKIVEEYGYYDISEFVLSLQEIEAAKMAEEVVEEEG
jgi:hypothetical protein